jgi:hypothetical protein
VFGVRAVSTTIAQARRARTILDFKTQRRLERQYMDAPTLPSFQFMRARRIRVHQYIRTLAAAQAAVPDGFC